MICWASIKWMKRRDSLAGGRNRLASFFAQRGSKATTPSLADGESISRQRGGGGAMIRQRGSGGGIWPGWLAGWVVEPPCLQPATRTDIDKLQAPLQCRKPRSSYIRYGWHSLYSAPSTFTGTCTYTGSRRRRRRTIDAHSLSEIDSLDIK